MGDVEYTVGRFKLTPDRQLLEGDRPVLIGRKGLELLTVLAKAGGAVVTKDELMAAVWPGLIVEENALQAHVAALRKALGQDAGLLNTVHGLGYRLAPAGASPIASEPATQAAPPALVKGWAPQIVSAALSLAAIAAAMLWPLRDHLPWASPPSYARVAVLPFDTTGAGPQASVFADGLFDETVSMLSDSQIQAVTKTQSQLLRAANADQAIARLGVGLLLDGSVRTDGNDLDVRVHLDDAREHVTIWSDEFHGQASAPRALEATVAAHAADVAYWAQVGRSGRVRLDATSLAAFIAGRESTTGVRHGDDGSALSEYRKVVAASPDFSWGHSGVATSEVFELLGQPASPAADALRADARREATRALSLDPHNGEAYVALELSLPTHDWSGREALLVRGVAADPGFEPAAMMEGRLLWVIGRGRDAVGWFERAHNLDPLHNGATFSLALNLLAEGHPADSRALVAQMRAQWPEHAATKDARLWTSIVAGATHDALALLADPAARPLGMDQTSVEAWRAALAASSSRDGKTRADAAKMVTAAVDVGSLGHGPAMTLLAMLGDLDGAFDQAKHYEPLDPYSPPYLFLPPTAPMRSDSRFMGLAHRLGLADYWRSTGHWPDFCAEPGLPYDCKAEAAKALAMVPR